MHRGTERTSFPIVRSDVNKGLMKTGGRSEQRVSKAWRGINERAWNGLRKMSSACTSSTKPHCILVAFRELHFKSSLSLSLSLSFSLFLSEGERVVKPERGQSLDEALPTFHAPAFFFSSPLSTSFPEYFFHLFNVRSRKLFQRSS